MQYYMPTHILEEEGVVWKQRQRWTALGTKALIVTGKQSAKKNGAYKDVVKALDDRGISHSLFDEITENPPYEQVARGAAVGHDCDFVIGIGGGSPIDAAKGIALAIKNPDKPIFDLLYRTKASTALPLVAIATTGGTGTETTPYAVFTDHDLRTKTSMSQRVFPVYGLMDVTYLMHLPKGVRNSTCVDALTHSIESYMNTNATPYSDYIALESIRLWGTVKEALLKEDNDPEAMKAFMRASTLAGMAIAQTGTSIAHSMGYPLTYEHGVAHGKANGVLMGVYLNACSHKKKVADILQALGFEVVSALGGYLRDVLGTVHIEEKDIHIYADQMMANERKLKNHPDAITKEAVITMYKMAVGDLQ